MGDVSLPVHERGWHMGWTQDGLDETWTKQECQMLAIHYPDHGLEWGGWAMLLPRRTRSAIRRQVVLLGIVRQPQWTERELRLIRRHYPEHGGSWEGWAELLPGRTRGAIVAQAGRMGVRCTWKSQPGRLRWTEEEDEMCRIAVSKLAARLGRSYRSIGSHIVNRAGRWTE